MPTIHDLLTEKLRPKRFEHLILTDRVRTALGNGKLLQNVLLYGSPGTGKTSAAKVLSNGSPCLYINVSDESSVEVIRTKITDFCSSMAIDFESEESSNAPKQENGLPIKMVILDECLSELEFVRIGTIDKWEPIQLTDLIKGIIYPCVSMNIETGELENDTCEIISEKIDDLYEIELEDGRIIRVTSNHPFMVNNNGKNIEKSIDDGLDLNDSICTFL